MKNRFYIPLRIKILIALLFVVTAIVSVITFTMASMFHDDKSAYVTDLVSHAVISAAEETHAVLDGYASRLTSAGRALREDKIPAETKRQMLNGFFTDFQELSALSVRVEGREPLSAIDPADTQDTGVSAEDLQNLLDKAPAEAKDDVVVRNVSPSGKMPALLMVVHVPAEGEQPPAVISAIVRSDGLMPIASRSPSLDIAISDANGVLLVDRDPSRVTGHSRLGFEIPQDAATSALRSGVTRQIDIGSQAFIAGTASARIGGVTAVATLPAATAFLASRSLLQRLMLVTLALLIVAALGGAIWAGRITGPVERLSAATVEIAHGRFDAQVTVESADEIGSLGQAFNTMATELKNRDAALQEAQEQLVQSEKMAAFGVLGAGIAHEVKNPLAGILGCAQISLRQAQAGTPMHANLVLIEKETKRCKTIIENLLRFARQEKAVMETFDVARPLEDAFTIVHHQLELQHVKLETSLGSGLPPIKGNANQLQQVFMNMLINAQQAMGEDGGSIMVSSGLRDAKHVEIVVRDTGSGIPKEIQKRIFDPFFTTKPNGKGTGLGLSVTYGIIKDHGGEILLDSAPGKGTTFTIILPAAVDADRPAESLELAGVRG